MPQSLENDGYFSRIITVDDKANTRLTEDFYKPLLLFSTCSTIVDAQRDVPFYTYVPYARLAPLD